MKVLHLALLASLVTTLPRIAQAQDPFGVVAVSGPYRLENTTACPQLNFHFAILRNELHGREIKGYDAYFKQVVAQVRGSYIRQCRDAEAFSKTREWVKQGYDQCHQVCSENAQNLGNPLALAFGLKKFREKAARDCDNACFDSIDQVRAVWSHLNREAERDERTTCHIRLSEIQKKLARPESITVNPGWIAGIQEILDLRITEVTAADPTKRANDPRVEAFRQQLLARDKAEKIPDCVYQLEKVKSVVQSVARTPEQTSTLVKQLQEAVVTTRPWWRKAFDAGQAQ
jgi:hypothetical protein